MLVRNEAMLCCSRLLPQGPGAAIAGAVFYAAAFRQAVKRTIPRLEGPARALARGELIGRSATVVESTDKGLVGLSGVVVDETLRTLVLRNAEGREVRVGKAENVFDFASPAGPVRVLGAAIEFRSEDRTKKVK